MKRKIFRSLAIACSIAMLVQTFPMVTLAQTEPTIPAAVTESESKTLLPIGSDINEEIATDITANEAEESPIVGEDTTRRTSNEKHFRKADGSFVQISYDEPIHYEKDGKWEEIDNTLIEKQRTDGSKYLTNKASDVDVELPTSSGTKNPVKISHNGYTLSWNLKNQLAVSPDIKQPAELEREELSQQKAASTASTQSMLSKQQRIIQENEEKVQLKNKRSAAIYPDMLPGTDIQYDVQSNGVKESIVLDKLPSDKSYTFHMEAADMSAVLEKDNSVAFYAKDKSEPEFIIKAPYMFDDNNCISEKISVSLKQTSTGWDYTITPDRAWLSDAARKYPVTIDPSVEVTDYEGVTESVSIYNGNTIASWTGVGTMKDNPSDTTSYELRTYLRIGNYFPRTKHRRILRAQLAMSYNGMAPDASSFTSFRVDMHRVKEDWWSNSIKYDPPEIGEMVDYAYVQSGGHYHYFDFTRLIYSWGRDDDLYPNYGFVLKPDKVLNQTNYARYEKPSSSSRPVVMLDYRDTTGVENYWTYTSMDSGYGGSTMVNNFSGNIVATQPLISADGNRMPVSIGLIYNTYFKNDPNTSESVTQDTFVGEGWKLNYQMYLLTSQVNSSVYPYVFVDADGTEHYFYKNASNTFVDEDGLGYTLTTGTATDAAYTITDKEGAKMIFNRDGLLKQISDTNSNSIILTYGSGSNSKRIEKIQDGANRTFTMFYEDSSKPYVLTGVSDPSGKKVLLSYADTAKTKLSKVTLSSFNPRKIICYLYKEGTFGSSLQSVYVPGVRETLISYKDKATSGWYDDDMVYAIQNINCDRVEGGTNGLISNWDTVVDSNDLLERYTFSYLDNTTVIVDKANRKTIYQFNHAGQAVQVQDVGTGTAAFYEFGLPGKDNTAGTQNKVLTSSEAQVPYNNYLKNHGFNSDSSEWVVFCNKSGQTYQTSYDSSKGHFGKGSVKIVQQSGTPGTVWYSQDVTNIGTATYTVSGYVNTGGTTLSGNDGAIIYLEVTEKDDPSKILRTATSNTIKKTNADEWQRLEVSIPFTYGERLRIFAGTTDDSVGSLWLDDFQVEKYETTNSYSLLEDGYMKNGWASWTTGAPGKFREGSGYATVSSTVGFPGSVTAQYSIYQDVKVNGTKGDTFSLGGFAKAFCLATNNDNRGTSKKATFRLELEFYNGTTKLTAQEPYYVEFNPYSLDWQYAAGRIIAPGTYDRVRVQLRYDYNANQVRFKSVHLSKEEFGQTYVYDKNGNVTSTKDLADSQSSFEYRNDQLSKILNPTGSRYMYTYNRDTKNMEFAIDADTGVLYRVSYDSNGNPTTTKTAGMKRATSLDTNKTYMLINAFSGNSVDNSGNSDGGSVKNWRFHISNENQYWKLGSTNETGVYTLQRAGNTSLVMTVENGSTANNANIKLKTYANQNAQKFKLVANGDGTYRILTKVSNYTKCIDSQPGDIHDTKDGVALQQYTYTANDEAQKWYLMEFDNQNSSQCTLYSESKATYTSDGNFMASQTDARGNTVQYTHNSNSGLLQKASDPKGNSVNYTYNANTKELTKVTATAAGSSSALATVNYTYRNGLLTKLNDYTLYYDDVERPVGVGIGSRRFSTETYNSHNMVGKTTYGNGALSTYWHDNFDRMTHLRKQSSASGTAQDYYYSYNNNGLLGLKKDLVSNTRTRYTYDMAGRLMRLRTTAGADTDGGAQKYAETYEYESKTNRLKSYTMTFGASETYAGSYKYGTASSGQIADAVYGVTFAGVERYKHAYDTLGRKSSDTINTGSKEIPTSYTYLTGTKSNITTSMLKSMTANGTTWSYEYDSVGNITKIYKNGTLEKEYTYDALGQMTQEIDHTTGYTSNYSYDTKGNITFMSGSGEGSYDTYLYRYEDSQWGDLMTGYDGIDITYDAIGNPLSYYSLHSFEWQNGRELTKYKWDGQVKGTYTYNDSGIRTSKTVNGHTNNITLSGSTIIRENPVGNIWLTYLYDEAGTRYGFQYKNGSVIKYYYYLYNGQGDVTEIVDSNGNTVAQYTYNAWGRLLSVKNGIGNAVSASSTTHIANLNPFRYRGYYYDNESGFYYLNSRYYDAKTGRFINADVYASSGQGMLSTNMFAYCLNNPVNMADTDGQMPAFLVGLGAALGGPVGIAIAVTGVAVIALVVVNTPEFQKGWENLYTGAAEAVSSLTASIEATKSKSIAEAKADSKDKDITLPTRKPHQYFGVEITNKSLRFITGPMTYDMAIDWVSSQASDNLRGRWESWGVYTLLKSDAERLGNYFNQKTGGLIFQNNHSKSSSCNPPFFDHYQLLGGLYDYYKKFHIWYGVAVG